MIWIEVRIPAHTLEIPKRLAAARFKLSKTAADRTVKSFRRVTPVGKTGKLRAGWRIKQTGVGGSGVGFRVYNPIRYARAQDRGAFIVPKNVTALRWKEGGGVRFSKGPIRLPAKHFMEKGAALARAQAPAAYKEAFWVLPKVSSG